MKVKSRFILLIAIIAMMCIFYTEISAASYNAVDTVTVSNVKAAVHKNGWTTKSGKKYYYFNNKPVTGIRRIDSTYYYFSSRGILQEGAYKWISVKNTWYYLQKNGTLKKGWLKYSGKKYYLSTTSSKMLVGLQTIGQKKYYFNPSTGEMTVGWKKISGKWYYFHPSYGTMITGFYRIGGVEYRFNSQGIMKTGLYTIGDSRFYSNSSGAVQTGWQKISQKWYYFRTKTEGSQRRASMVWGEKRKINGYYYYLNENGTMAEGWKTLGRYRYYFRTAKVNSRPEGSMVTGWMTLQNSRYYFSAAGIMQKGWENINGKKYYFSSSGTMLRNTWVDSSHYVGNDGAWIEGYPLANSSNALRWPLSSTRNTITSYYNSLVQSSGNIHKGIYIAAPSGSAVYAVKAGTVITKKLASSGDGFGNWIQISHGNGMVTQYCHMSKFGLRIYEGAKVKQGQIVDYVGSTGNATGPHLHFGIRLNGVYQNPLKYVKRPNT